MPCVAAEKMHQDHSNASHLLSSCSRATHSHFYCFPARTLTFCFCGALAGGCCGCWDCSCAPSAVEDDTCPFISLHKENSKYMSLSFCREWAWPGVSSMLEAFQPSSFLPILCTCTSSVAHCHLPKKRATASKQIWVAQGIGAQRTRRERPSTTHPAYPNRLFNALLSHTRLHTHCGQV